MSFAALKALYFLTRCQLRFGGEDPLNGPWHHEDMTAVAARNAQWTPEAAESLKWHAGAVDSYLYNPLFWAQGGFDRFKAALRTHDELVKLHFDDLGATSQISTMWTRYQGGTVVGLRWAAARNDVQAARHIVGAGLHAIQDFYSHSNWVDVPERRAITWGEAGFRPVWRDAQEVYTGSYEKPETATLRPHGKINFTCSLLRQLPSGLMDAACHALSPFSNSSTCRQWLACKSGAEAPKQTTIGGVPIPDNVLYVEPKGIALDSKWLAKIAREVRNVGDVDGETLFNAAYRLAARETAAWLVQLDRYAETYRYQEFWQRVKTDPRDKAAEQAQYEAARRAGFTFMSAGAYPPSADGRDEGWFLRLEIATADVEGAGTDADIVAVVDGQQYVLDHMHDRHPNGSTVGDMRIFEYDDFERGKRTAYVIGPFKNRPATLTLLNRSADLGDVLKGLWSDIVDGVSGAVDYLRDVALSVVGGHADYVGQAILTWQWADLERTIGKPAAFEMRCSRAGEGDYTLAGTIASVETPTGLRAAVALKTLHCNRESTSDMGTSDDEPFVLLLANAPASGQTPTDVIGPFKFVDTGETRNNPNPPLSLDVPRFSGLIVGAQVWESDLESAADRRRALSAFATGYSAKTTNERSAFLDAWGRFYRPAWKLEQVDGWAFHRARNELHHNIPNWTPRYWVHGGKSMAVPLEWPIDPSTVRFELVNFPDRVTDIAAGWGGEVWVIARDAVPGGQQILRYIPIMRTWMPVDGGAVRIAVDPAGKAWVVNAAGQIFRRSTAGWELLPGLANDIAVGPNNTAWVIGKDASNGGYGIHRWNGTGWERIDGAAVRIAVAPNGLPWVVNSYGQIFERTPNGWQLKPGTATDIAIGPEGEAWIVGAPPLDGVCRWDGTNWAPTAKPLRDATNISVGARGTPWVTTNNQQISRAAD